VYQVGINKGIILRCTAYQISRIQCTSASSHIIILFYFVSYTLYISHELQLNLPVARGRQLFKFTNYLNFTTKLNLKLISVTVTT